MQARQGTIPTPTSTKPSAQFIDDLNTTLSFLRKSIAQSEQMLETAQSPLKEKLAELHDLHLDHIDALMKKVEEFGGTPSRPVEDESYSVESLTDGHEAERLLLPYCQHEQKIINRCVEQLYTVADDESLTTVLMQIRDQTRDQVLSLFNSRSQ